VDLSEQVAGPVEERAIDASCTSDAGDADLGAGGPSLADRGYDPLAAPRGVGLAAGSHLLGSGGRG